MTRTRRDPRSERAAARAAAGERPRFDLAVRRETSRRSRRDPRAELAGQFVGNGARRRLDRSPVGAAPFPEGAPERRRAAAAPPETIVIAHAEFYVMVVPDLPGGRLGDHDRQLLGAARELAGKSGAVLALAGPGCAGLRAAGADRVADPGLPDGPEAYDPETRAAAVIGAIRALKPRNVLFAETADGGDLARRVAVHSGESLFTDVEQISASSLSRPARVRKVEQRSSPTRLVTLAADAAAPYAGPPREARQEPLDAPVDRRATPKSPILSARRILADPSTVPLALADFVASAGNGVTDLDMFRRLVAALGATPGASRVLCDAGLMPREAQVGASGTVLAATCYFALGIAGAPQHLQGVADCEHIVAVNTDLHAAMVARAGLGIIQDAQLVMPALLQALADEHGEDAR